MHAVACVQVELLQEVELTAVLAQKQSTWCALAFKWSPAGRAFAARLQETDAEEEKEREREAERRAEVDRSAITDLLRQLEHVAMTNDRLRLDALVDSDW
jgi:ribosomal protein L12E/L44/L45/RPP1/RPP2